MPNPETTDAAANVTAAFDAAFAAFYPRAFPSAFKRRMVTDALRAFLLAAHSAVGETRERTLREWAAALEQKEVRGHD